MVELIKAVKQAVAQGKKLDDIVTMKDGKPVATSMSCPPSADHWVSNSARRPRRRCIQRGHAE